EILNHSFTIVKISCRLAIHSNGFLKIHPGNYKDLACRCIYIEREFIFFLSIKKAIRAFISYLRTLPEPFTGILQIYLHHGFIYILLIKFMFNMAIKILCITN